MDNTILLHYIEGNASAEEKREVILWLEESPRNMEEYMKCRKVYDLNIWNSGRDYAPVKQQKHYRIRRYFAELLKIAAVFVIGILLSALYFTSAKDKEGEPLMQTIHVPAGQRTEVLLGDGTKVWLNSGTTFTFPGQFTRKSREVTLEGEGFFKVARKEGASFTVHSGKYDVKVLGTEFNLKSYSGRGIFEAALLKGKIDVSSTDEKESLHLQPNEKVFLADKGLQKAGIGDYNYFRWREGLVCFEKENVASLFSKLELYYDIKINVGKTSFLDESYTGKFRIRDGIEHVLKVLQLKHNFEYIKDDETNVITIK